MLFGEQDIVRFANLCYMAVSNQGSLESIAVPCQLQPHDMCPLQGLPDCNVSGGDVPDICR